MPASAGDDAAAGAGAATAQPTTGENNTKKSFPKNKNTTRITWKGKPYIGVKEGLATILQPETTEQQAEAKKKQKHEDGSEVQQVFYNPIQQFNRDLTVLAIKAYGEEVVERKQKYAENGRKMKSKKRKNGEAGVESRPSKVAKTEDHDDASTPQAGASTGVPTDIVGETTKIKPEEAETEEPTTGGQEATGKTKPNSTDGEKLQPPPPQTKFTILDALSASGLRALRYAQEIPFVTSVTANDLMSSAVESIKTNAEYNGLSEKIRANRDDARGYMYKVIASALDQLATKNAFASNNKKYDVVDLDPYGTAAPFLDCSIQSVRDDGGLLCVTCTDSPTFAGTGYPEKTYALYGGVPMKGVHSHEAGLRLVLHAIAGVAARYGLAIEPLLSLSIDYYLRIFVRVRKSPAAVKFLSAKTMVVYTCDQGCTAWKTQLLAKNKVAPNKRGTGTFYKHGFALAPVADMHCEHCGSKMHLGGPLYAGRLHDNGFVEKILDELDEADGEVYGTKGRIEGMLRTAVEEWIPPPPGEEELDPPPDAHLAVVEPYPFFFVPAALARILHCQTPQEDAIRGALIGLGYRVTRSHCKPGSLRTDAPWKVIWHVMREFVRQRAPIKKESIKEGSVAYRLLRLGQTEEEEGGGGGGGGVGRGEGEDKNTMMKMPEVVFDEKLGRESSNKRDAEGKKIVRYPMNPAKNWGPMNKALGS